MKQKTFTCCICGKKTKGYGNNPYPIKESGRCCDSCNNDVIFARIVEAYSIKNSKKITDSNVKNSKTNN